MSQTITPDMTINDVLSIDRGLAAVFFEFGMFCLGCPSAAGESIADAAQVHGIDADALVAKLNAFLTAPKE